MTLRRQLRIMLSAMAIGCAGIGAGCSSAPNSANAVTDNSAGSTVSQTPRSRLLADNVAAEFRPQAEIMDQYCEQSGYDWPQKVERLLAAVNERTGKKVTLKQVYDRAAKLAPELALDPEVNKLHEDIYHCEELLGRTVKDLSGIQ